jgi:hypothetical protein
MPRLEEKKRTTQVGSTYLRFLVVVRNVKRQNFEIQIVFMKMYTSPNDLGPLLWFKNIFGEKNCEKIGVFDS